MLAVSCNLLGTVVEVKSSMAVWVRNGPPCIVVSPVVTRLTGSGPAQHHERGSDHTALPSKGQISASEVSFYCSRSIAGRGPSAPRSPCGYDGAPVPIKGKQGWSALWEDPADDGSLKSSPSHISIIPSESLQLKCLLKF